MTDAEEQAYHEFMWKDRRGSCGKDYFAAALRYAAKHGYISPPERCRIAFCNHCGNAIFDNENTFRDEDGAYYHLGEEKL